MDNVGFFMVGAVVGFCVFYFVRRFEKFSPAVLAAVLSAAVFGPLALKFFKVLGENLSGYFAGFGTGFFLFVLYSALVTILAARGFIERRDVELLLESGGPGYGEMLDAETLSHAIDEYSKGEIKKSELVDRIRNSGVTKRDYQKMKTASSRRTKRKLKQPHGIAETVEKMEKLGLEKELPTK